MKELLNFLIIIVIMLFVYVLMNRNNKNNNDDYKYVDEIFENIEYNKDISNKNKQKQCKKQNKQQVKENKQIKQNNTNNDLIKPYFIENRVHNDYRDTLTAFNNVAPDQRPIFNKSALPVKQINVNPIEVKPLVKAFIKRVNDEVKHNVTDIQHTNSGWDELVQEEKKDGWGDYMNQLGLPESIYNQPAKRSQIKLIKIDYIQKFATETQLNFIVHMIIQKTNTEDQMIIKVSYVMDNIDINAERNFNKTEHDVDFNVKIEEISIIGFLTDHSYGDKLERKDFYEFVDIEKDNILSDELILKALKDKYKQRQIESDGFNTIIAPTKKNNTALERLNKNAQLLPMEHTDNF